MAKRKSASRGSRRATTPEPEIDSLREAEDLGLAELISSLDQAQTAQKALAQAHKKVRSLQKQQDGVQVKALAAVTGERDEATARADGLAAALAQAEKELTATLKPFRSLALSLVGMPDPLAPLVADDSDGELASLQQQLKDQIDRKAGQPSDLPGMAEAVAAMRSLIDQYVGRIKLQGNRVKLLRRHVDELEADQRSGEEERDTLHSLGAELKTELTTAQSELVSAQKTIAGLQDDLEEAATKAETQAAEQLAFAEQAEQTEADLQSRIEQADATNTELDGQLTAAGELARKAERAAVAVAETLVDLAGADMAVAALADAPSIGIQKDELEALVNDAGDDFDDEIDDLFRQDFGEDLVSAARGLLDGLQRRREAVVEELVDLRQQAEDLRQGIDERDEDLDAARQDLQRTENALNRAESQLEASQAEIERLSAELKERSADLKATKDRLARAETELETLRKRSELADELKEELGRTRTDLTAVSKSADQRGNDFQRVAESCGRLARSIIELATVTDGTLADADLKVGGHVSRFTQSFQKLDSAAPQKADDLLRALKTANDVVDKVGNRIGHIRGVLLKRGASLTALEQQVTTLEGQQEQSQRSVTLQGDQIRELKSEKSELARVAKKAAKLEDQLDKRSTKLVAAEDQVKNLKQELRLAQAEVEEVLAREAESSGSLGDEVADLRRRLADEQRLRREGESELQDQLEQAQAQLSTAEVKVAEYEATIERREDRLTTLQDELDHAGEQAAVITELEARVTHGDEELTAARTRIVQLERELEDQAEADTLAAELDEVQAERDDLRKKLRAAEKRLADEAGKVAKAEHLSKSTEDKLRKVSRYYEDEQKDLQVRLDETKEAYRREKEKNAGLDAKVRRLTGSRAE